jgi:hypothetical protein
MPPIRAAAVFAFALSCAWAAPDSMHPDFELKEVPLGAKYKTMGMGFLSDGRLAIATSEFIGLGEAPDSAGANRKVLIISDPGGTAPKVKEISNTWLQPTGLVVVDDTIYVADRDGFYQVPDNEAPADLAGNRRKIASWPDTSDWYSGKYWHQWVFSPVYWQGNFYAPYSGSIGAGGWSLVPPSTSYSGAFLKWDRSGKLEKVAGGLRSPNGCNIDPSGTMFVTDNQGSWLPSSTFMRVKPGVFYGHRQVPVWSEDGKPTVTFPPNWAESLPYERPTAWLDHGNLRSSPSQPVYVEKGTYAGDWLLGDVNNPGLVRIGLDEVEGTYNGCVFWFGDGFRGRAINRLAWGKDGALYVGTLMNLGNWPTGEPASLFRMAPKTVSVPAFDMRSIRHLADGVEILFTQAVDPGTVTVGNFPVVQWNYVREGGYGLGKGDKESRKVTAVELSDDGKRVHVVIEGLKDDYVAYFKLDQVKSAGGRALWSKEAWLTLNKLSSRSWNPTLTFADGPRPSPSLAGHVRRHRGPSGLRIDLDIGGRAEATLLGLDGRRLAAAAGERSVELPTSTLPRGVYLLEIRHAAGKLSSPVTLGD